jgi:hypothetical protein
MPDDPNPQPDPVQPPPVDPPADPPKEQDPPGAGALGDAGKQALDRMKAERNAAREEARKAAEELARLRAESEGKKAEYEADQQKRQVEAEALSKANARIVRSEVKAAAKGVLADPADAYKFLDLDKFEVGEDGEVDDAAITAALEDLVKQKPYLAVQDGKRFQGSADGGARKESRPAQLSKADVERMYANKQYAEIEKARQEGRLTDVLGATT